MVSILYNDINTTTFFIPINITDYRLFTLTDRPDAERLQALIDLFNRTTERKMISSPTQPMIMMDKNDLQNMILLLGFTIIIILLSFILGGLYRQMCRDWFQRKRTYYLHKQNVMNLHNKNHNDKTITKYFYDQQQYI